MGFALAQAFSQAGAHVMLVAGPVDLPTPDGVNRFDVATAQQMHEQVMRLVGDCDIFAACAAVADYRVEDKAQQKLKKSDKNISLQLVPNKDILADVARMKNPPFTLGFAAETENLVQFASEKRKRKGIDVIAANLVGGKQGGFADDNNALTVIWQEGQREMPMTGKQQLAHQLVALIVDILDRKANGIIRFQGKA